MADNPFNQLIEVIREESAPVGPGNLVMGKVQSVSPLRILVDGTQQTAESLLANAGLLPGAEMTVAGEGEGQVYIEDAAGAVAGAVEFHGSLLLERQSDAWAAGDQLLMLAIEERQRYIILCKVVSL